MTSRTLPAALDEHPHGSSGLILNACEFRAGFAQRARRADHRAAIDGDRVSPSIT